LYARFVDYALGRETEGSARNRTARELLLRWLGWLAAEMRSHDQSQFAFEYLDWSWLPSKNVQRAAKGFACLILGLVLALVFAPVLRLGGGLLIGLLFGQFLGWDGLSSGTASGRGVLLLMEKFEERAGRGAEHDGAREVNVAVAAAQGQ